MAEKEARRQLLADDARPADEPEEGDRGVGIFWKLPAYRAHAYTRYAWEILWLYCHRVTLMEVKNFLITLKDYESKVEEWGSNARPHWHKTAGILKIFTLILGRLAKSL